VVEKFSSKLKPLGIIVRELTGDMQLSRAEADAAHVSAADIVNTIACLQRLTQFLFAEIDLGDHSRKVGRGHSQRWGWYIRLYMRPVNN
jgi:hypothetical protein